MTDLATAYSRSLTCLYDEKSPSAAVGRGTHYSVFRIPVVLGPSRPSIEKVRDIAVIWDEDHDLRVITVLERLLSKNLLAHVVFVGERKGAMTVLVEDRFFYSTTSYQITQYANRVAKQVASIGGDHWQAVIGSFSPSGINERTNLEAIIHADDHVVEPYLRSIGLRWGLGTKSAGSQPMPETQWNDRERLPREKPCKSDLPSWMTMEEETG